MLFSAKVEQEIRPMNELSDKRIEDLPTHGKVGLGGGEGGREKKFPQRCNRHDGESKRGPTRECMLLYIMFGFSFVTANGTLPTILDNRAIHYRDGSVTSKFTNHRTLTLKVKWHWKKEVFLLRRIDYVLTKLALMKEYKRK